MELFYNTEIYNHVCNPNILFKKENARKKAKRKERYKTYVLTFFLLYLFIWSSAHYEHFIFLLSEAYSKFIKLN